MLSVSLLMLSFTATEIKADVYHYIDDSGKKVYVDRASQIPQEQRAKAKVYTSYGSSSDHPSAQNSAKDPFAEPLSSTDQLKNFIKTLETPIEIQGNGVLVPVTVVHGAITKELNLLLDTGASNTVVHEDAAKVLMQKFLPAGQSRIADGSVIDVSKVQFGKVSIGPFSMQPATMRVIDHKGYSWHDGLLGMDFLRQVKYEVDFERKLIIWSPEKYREAQNELARIAEQDDSKEEGTAPIDE